MEPSAPLGYGWKRRTDGKKAWMDRDVTAENTSPKTFYSPNSSPKTETLSGRRCPKMELRVSPQGPPSVAENETHRARTSHAIQELTCDIAQHAI